MQVSAEGSGTGEGLSGSVWIAASPPKGRLDIAMTLVGSPRIIFLDQPTTGLDPRSRHNTWQIIGELV